MARNRVYQVKSSPSLSPWSVESEDVANGRVTGWRSRGGADGGARRRGRHRRTEQQISTNGGGGALLPRLGFGGGDDDELCWQLW
jgi:hypothetical protein